MRDEVIFQLIEEEKNRQLHGIELIASENFVSQQVMDAMGSVLTNKYAEGLPGKRYYGGCQVVDKVEQLAIDRLCELFGATWANVQPHSGAQANAAVFLACLNPGDKILGFDCLMVDTLHTVLLSIFRENFMCHFSMVFRKKQGSLTTISWRKLPKEKSLK